MQLSLFISVVAGHGGMIFPLPRNSNMKSPSLPTVPPLLHGCEGYSCMWFSQACTPGCKECTGISKKGADPNIPNCKLPDSFEPWLKQSQKDYITYAVNDTDAGTYKYSPWRSPGEAPVYDSCGVAAGSPKDNSAAGGHAPPKPDGSGNYTNGFAGSKLPPTPKKEKWVIGQTAPVAFGLIANHGGGYQYRLCPAGSTLDEECFHKTRLEFAGPKSTFYWAEGPNANKTFDVDAVNVKARDGSVWRKNPIPAFACPEGGVAGKCKGDGPQFKPLIEGDMFWGFGDYDEYHSKDAKHVRYLPYVRDHVKVPKIALGQYVLSWRWDCEQTAQVWNSCADIEIVADELII